MTSRVCGRTDKVRGYGYAHSDGRRNPQVRDHLPHLPRRGHPPGARRRRGRRGAAAAARAAPGRPAAVVAGGDGAGVGAAVRRRRRRARGAGPSGAAAGGSSASVAACSGGTRRWPTSSSTPASRTCSPSAPVDYARVPTCPDSSRQVVAFGLHLFTYDGVPEAVLQRSQERQFGREVPELEVLSASGDVAPAMLDALRGLMTERSLLRGTSRTATSSPRTAPTLPAHSGCSSWCSTPSTAWPTTPTSRSSSPPTAPTCSSPPSPERHRGAQPQPLRRRDGWSRRRAGRGRRGWAAAGPRPALT